MHTEKQVVTIPVPQKFVPLMMSFNYLNVLGAHIQSNLISNNDKKD